MACMRIWKAWKKPWLWGSVTMEKMCSSGCLLHDPHECIYCKDMTLCGFSLFTDTAECTARVYHTTKKMKQFFIQEWTCFFRRDIQGKQYLQLTLGCPINRHERIREIFFFLAVRKFSYSFCFRISYFYIWRLFLQPTDRLGLRQQMHLKKPYVLKGNLWGHV